MNGYYSPLRYPGGKARLTNYLAALIASKSNNKDVIFVEPFAGGAGAALTLLCTGKVSRIVINDLDPAIYAFWKTAVYNTDYLIRKISRTNISIGEWKKQQLIYRNKTTNDAKLAFATFFLNRTNRSGIIEGGPIGGFDQAGEWKLDARFNKKSLIERLKVIQSFKDQIEVTNLDGIKLLQKIQCKDSYANHFIFIDPPYIEKGQLLYLNHYQEKNHENLATFLNTSILDWIMTYDDTPYVHKLYINKAVRKFKIPYTAHSRKVGKEVIISPQPLKTPPKLVI